MSEDPKYIHPNPYNNIESITFLMDANGGSYYLSIVFLGNRHVVFIDYVITI